MRYVIGVRVLFAVVAALLLAGRCLAGVPVVSNVTVTDVTPVSFSVAWTSSEASTAALNVFFDQGATAPVPGLVLVSQPVQGEDPSVAQSAENLGVMKVQVTGLDPNTIYYFQTVTTSKSSSQTTYNPAAAPMPEVTTENAVVRTKFLGDQQVPFTNAPISLDCYLPGGSTTAPTGSLVLAAVDGANYPVSGFVGDGAPSGKAWIDLNNLYSSHDFLTLEVYGGESMLVTTLMGASGIDGGSFYVPVSHHIGETKAAPIRPPCWGDFGGDGSVDAADLTAFAARFGRGNCVPGHLCEGDFEWDRDVDGLNLAVFAEDVGRLDCP